MFRAAATTSPQPGTTEAGLRQVCPLGKAETGQQGGRGGIPKRELPDIAEPPVGIDKMIAGIDIPVVLYCQISSAALAEGADTRLYPAPGRQGRVEGKDKVAPDIPFHPLIENIAEIPAECFRSHGPRGKDGLRLPWRSNPHGLPSGHG